ncbi:MAG: glycoside hydrolase family 28 protein [Bacteroidetes bacterium]|nr:MAG: glycoside hydrolase family 28 protein [Bacteroidota bacterium]
MPVSVRHTILCCALSLLSGVPMTAGEDTPTAAGIAARVVRPVFPDRTFDITAYGAKGDGTADATEAIRRAVTACTESGGGRVLVPSGTYLTGPIHLESGVELHLADGAVVRFSTDPSRYLPLVRTRWEGMEVMNYSPLIYAFRKKNIAVTGKGVLDGQGSSEHWWPWKGKSDDGGWKPGMPHQKAGRDRLLAMTENGTPAAERVFGDGYYLRPSFFQPYECTNVLVEGVTFRDAPMWFIHPVLCTSVTVTGVTVQGHGPNNDGCNPESSRDVLIEDCFFDTGDDCIAVKSGRNRDGRDIGVPSENIAVRRCRMKEGHGGVVIGSEVSGGARNIAVEECTMDSPRLDRAIRIKTNSVRGGTVENIAVRNLTVGQVAEAVVLVDFNYEEGDAGAHTPIVRNILLENVTARSGPYAFFLKGYRRSPVTGITARDCTFDGITAGNVFQHTDGIRFTNVIMNGRPLSAPR